MTCWCVGQQNSELFGGATSAPRLAMKQYNDETRCMTPHATGLAINKDISSTLRTVYTEKDKHSRYRDHHDTPGARRRATIKDTTKGEARFITIRQHLGYGSRYISFDLSLGWRWSSSLGGGVFKKQTKNQKQTKKSLLF
jgi:hypothetical protein